MTGFPLNATITSSDWEPAFSEFVHSHRLQGWLVIESAAVSYGKASAYGPVIDLRKSYFQIEERDDPCTRRRRSARLGNTVRRSCWGEPWQVSEVRTAAGQARVLFYPCGARAYYLTFQAGKLTSVYSE